MGFLSSSQLDSSRPFFFVFSLSFLLLQSNSETTLKFETETPKNMKQRFYALQKTCKKWSPLLSPQINKGVNDWNESEDAAMTGGQGEGQVQWFRKQEAAEIFREGEDRGETAPGWWEWMDHADAGYLCRGVALRRLRPHGRPGSGLPQLLAVNNGGIRRGR
jgi:hypothetical protein